MNQTHRNTDPDFIAPDGKKSWKRDKAYQVIQDCMEAGQAILQIRTWCVLRHIYDDLTVTESIHLDKENIRLFSSQVPFDWDEETESWKEFASRSCEAAKKFLDQNQVEEIIVEPMKDTVHYYIEDISESDFLN